MSGLLVPVMPTAIEETTWGEVHDGDYVLHQGVAYLVWRDNANPRQVALTRIDCHTVYGQPTPDYPVGRIIRGVNSQVVQTLRDKGFAVSTIYERRGPLLWISQLAERSSSPG